MLEYARDLLIASCQTNFLAIVAWQSTVWLGLGLIAGRVLRRQAAKAHCVLVLATAAAVATPLLTLSVRQMDWGLAGSSIGSIEQSAFPSNRDRDGRWTVRNRRPLRSPR